MGKGRGKCRGEQSGEGRGEKRGIGLGGNGRHGGKEEFEYVANRSKIKKNC